MEAQAQAVWALGEAKAEVERQVRALLFFFFITLGLELSDTTSLQAFNTSPPRNFFSLLPSNCS